MERNIFLKIKQLLTNPSHFATNALYEHIKKNSHFLKGKILDVGCGKKPYKSLFNYTGYIGIDVDSVHDHTNEDIDIIYDGKNIPFPDNTFDSAIFTQVLEHVFEPEIILKEIHRVLKPGGKCILTVPFIWIEHEMPYDYGRYSSSGIKYLLEKMGFKVLVQEKTLSDIRGIFQMINLYRYNIWPSLDKYKILKFLTKTLFYAFNNLTGQILNYILPKNEYLFLDNVLVIEKSFSDKEK